MSSLALKVSPDAVLSVTLFYRKSNSTMSVSSI